MEPTFRVGETVKLDEPGDSMEVGQIVVFDAPLGAESDTCGEPRGGRGTERMCAKPTATRMDAEFIKRIVAGPGDRVALRNGHLILNGKPVDESAYTLECGVGGDCTFSEEITVPDDHWFMLGDNRGESDDSRFWGPVPTRWIRGVVEVDN